VCTEAVLVAESIKTTPTAATTAKIFDKSYQCSIKSKLRGYWNCLFKEKQCYSNDECLKKNNQTRCCPTVCGNECLGNRNLFACRKYYFNLLIFLFLDVTPTE